MVHEGVRAGQKQVIDNAYKKYDDTFPNRKTHEKQFRETMDIIGDIASADLPNLKFRATRLFYPFFCAVFHLKFGLPRFTASRNPIKVSDYPKLKMVLERINELITRIEAAEAAHEDISLLVEERKFYDAYTEHWVHADKRTLLADYICKQFTKALRS